MKTATTINALQAQMNEIISQFGNDACIAHAESVYSQTFRSEGVRICDHLNSFCKSQDEYQAEFRSISVEIWGEIKSELYIKATGNAMPELDFDDSDDDFEFCGDDEYHDSDMMEIGHAKECWRIERDAWIESKGLVSGDFIKETTEIVFLCNYKGEGEGGIAPLNSETEKLPIFNSRSESFSI